MKSALFIIFFLYGVAGLAEKKNNLNPYQSSIQKCIDKKLDFKSLDNNKQLYDLIEKNYALTSSETLYREVSYSQKGLERKLKYEDGVVQLFSVDDEDESIKLLSSEKLTDKNGDYQARHKVKSVEAQLSQLLFRADIKSDYSKVKEIRAKQVVLNIVWSDNQIKSLNVDFLNEKKALSCVQKEQSDICSCRSL